MLFCTIPSLFIKKIAFFKVSYSQHLYFLARQRRMIKPEIERFCASCVKGYFPPSLFHHPLFPHGLTVCRITKPRLKKIYFFFILSKLTFQVFYRCWFKSKGQKYVVQWFYFCKLINEFHFKNVITFEWRKLSLDFWGKIQHDSSLIYDVRYCSGSTMRVFVCVQFFSFQGFFKPISPSLHFWPSKIHGKKTTTFSP